MKVNSKSGSEEVRIQSSPNLTKSESDQVLFLQSRNPTFLPKSESDGKSESDLVRIRPGPNPTMSILNQGLVNG